MPPKRGTASPARAAAVRRVQQPEQEQEQQEQQRERQDEGARDDSEQPLARRPASATTCAVCLTEPANFLCSPCGHQCGCEACLRQVQATGGSKCPICRVPFSAIQRVYQAGSEAMADEPAAAGVGGSRGGSAQQQLGGGAGMMTPPRLVGGGGGQARQLGDMADSGMMTQEEQAWDGDELQQPLMGRAPSTAEPKRSRACCCGTLLALVWVATAGLVYGTDQPCGIARGWHGSAASPTLGCNETWGGSCENHTCKCTSNHSWINQAPEWLGSIKRRKVV